MKKFSTLLSFLLILFTTKAQVNGYAKITGIIGPVLTVSNVNETYDQFNIGDRVIVMQMQDDVIGSNTLQNSSFGSLGTIANAGRYEVATVLLVARVAGLLNVVTLSAPLSNAYNLGTNSSVQLISFPNLGNPNYTTSSNITALPWDGNIGGVVAFNVPGTLQLNHNILADNAGFRGGVRDPNDGTNADCNTTTFYGAASVLHGSKGEGIYKSTNANYAGAVGKMINGGGGGNGHNGGGGGGSNYSGGGNGGDGYGCSSGSGGYGGETLSSHITGLRYFLGGGGGSGEANNGGDNRGGNGGGIVILKANQVTTTGSTARRISANGDAGGSVGNDGAGGGGAGGSLMMEVRQWSIASAAPLTLSADGGNGGNVNDGNRHGGGAGGGQGAVIFSDMVPVSNVSTTTTNGTGGLNYTGGSRAPSGSGTSNAGVINSTFIVLPVNLVSFLGTMPNGLVSLKWVSENEIKLSHYDVQFSENAADFYGIGKVKATGNGGNSASYQFASTVNFQGTHYYRLRMVDVDGKTSFSRIIALRVSSTEEQTRISVYPNPAKINPVLQVFASETGKASVSILNMHGAVISNENINLQGGSNTVVLQSVNNLPNGVHNIRVSLNGKIFNTRLIIQK